MSIAPFATRDFNSQLQRSLGKACLGAASVGEAMAPACEMIGTTVEFVRFTAAEGAGGHCEGAGREVFDERVYPWLRRTLQRA